MSQEEKSRSQQLNEFVEGVLLTLYELGLMPMRLAAKPAEFDKYPQRLFTLLETKGNVEDAFREWRSEVLRRAKFGSVKEEAYPHLVAFGRWLQDNRSLFESPGQGRRNMRHLKRSMYGSSFDYLYPRLSLIYEYRECCKGDSKAAEKVEVETPGGSKREFLRAVADENYIRANFQQATPVTQVRIADAYGQEQLASLVESAIAFLLQNRYYFNSVFTT
jgi:hypothetical protein